MTCSTHAFRRALAGSTAVLAFALSGCAASSIAKHRWTELSMPGMVVLSDASPEHGVALAREVHLFRQVLAYLAHVTPAEKPVPLRVVELGDPSDLALVTKSRWIAGVMTPRLEDNLAVIGGSIGSRDVLYHELVHILLRESGAKYPRWYEEGLAEFLSTVRVNGPKLEIGRPPPRFGLLILQMKAHAGKEAAQLGSHIQAGTGGPSADEVYSKWWAMVSFLTLGHVAGAGDDRRPQLAEFLGMLARGENEEAAYVKAFGMKREELEARAVSFLGSMKVPVAWIDMPDLERPPMPTSRPAPIDSVVCGLGEVARELDNASTARDLFETASQTPGESGCGIVGLERTLVAEKKVEAAEQAIAARLARDPEDPGALVARAELLMGPMSPSGKPPADMPAPKLEEARGLLRQVLASQPDHVLANLRLASSYRVGREDLGPAIAAIEKVLAVRTAAPEAYVVAGDLYLRSGDLRRAEVALETAVRLRGHKGVSGEASSLLADVEGRRAAGGR